MIRRRRPPEVVLAEVEARVAAKYEAKMRHKDRVISAERARSRNLAARADHWQKLYRDLAAGLVNARDLALAADTGSPSAVGNRSAASGESQAPGRSGKCGSGPGLPIRARSGS